MTAAFVTRWLALPSLLLLAGIAVVVRPVDGTCQMVWPEDERGPCSCDTLRINVYVLQCERRGLQAFPALPLHNVSKPQHSLVANFSFNSIASVDARFFRASTLPVTVLDLSHNALGELLAGSLPASVVGELRTLNVSHNRLRLVQPDAVPPKLELLDLSHNELPEPCSLPLAKTEHLRLGHNGVRRLRAHCFEATPAWSRMLRLDLGGNAIDQIAPGAFKSVDTLRSLVLDGNRLGGGADLLPSLEPLGDLRELSLRAGALTSLDALCAAPLPRALTALDLGDNRFDRVPPYCFKRYYGRREELALRLDGNRLAAIDENMFSGLELRLRSLDLSRNAIATVAAAAFDKMSELRSLDLAHNGISSLAFLCGWRADKLERLSVAGNRLRALPAAVVGCFRDKTSLLSLDLSGNRLLSVGGDAFAGLGRLLELDLSDNDLTSVADRAFADLTALRRLRLSSNALVYLRRCAFERLGGLVEFHYDANLLHCDCDLYWLKAYTAAISERGMSADAVSEPIRQATCASAAPGLVQGTGGIGGSVVDAMSACRGAPAEQCLGLSLLAIDVQRNDSGAVALNLTWQLAPSAAAASPGAAALVEPPAGLAEGSPLSLKVSLVDVATGEEQALGDWAGPYGGASAQYLPVAGARLQAGGVYKACIRLSALGGARRQSDCTVYPPDLQKPTAAPSAESRNTDEAEGLHPGAVAAIVLAVILALCIAAAVVVIYFMFRKWHSYRPRKEDELAGRDKNGGNRRSPLSSNESEADGGVEPNEHSPIKMADV